VRALIGRGVPGPAVAWSYRLLGAALAALALQEFLAGHLGVHAGELYGRRPDFLPLLPSAAMIALWLLQIGAGLALATGWRRRGALRVAVAAAALSLTQSYFNQKMFLTLTLAALAIDPPDPEDPALASDPGPAVRAARLQLLLLYLASAAFKLRDGFASGASLTAALEQVYERGLDAAVPAAGLLSLLAAVSFAAKALSCSTLAAEAVLPFLLLRRPLAGVRLAFGLHLAFALCLPGLWPFTLTACAVALLFLPPFRRIRE
jgi:hypothetical protein